MSIPLKLEIKQSAKRLAGVLKEEFGIEVSHTRSLHLMAKVHGSKNWNTLSSVLSDEKANPGSVGAVVAHLSNYDRNEPVLFAEDYGGTSPDYYLFEGFAGSEVPDLQNRPILTVATRGTAVDKLPRSPSTNSKVKFTAYSFEVCMRDGGSETIHDDSLGLLPIAINRGRKMMEQNPHITRINIHRHIQGQKILDHYLSREGEYIRG